MWNDIVISAPNQASYRELCHTLSQGQKVFECNHCQTLSQKGDRWGNSTPLSKKYRSNSEPQKGKDIKRKITSVAIEKERIKDMSLKVETDIGALQREVLCILQGSEAIEEGFGEAVGHLEVCQGAGEPLRDEVLLKVCKTAEKRESCVVALVGKLLLFPKLYHLETKLSTPVMDSITQLLECHTVVVVESVLLPLLHHLPALEEQHCDILSHLLPTCPEHLITRLLRVFSERPHHNETDLPTFHLLCKSANPKDPDTHPATLAVLGRISHLLCASVKFGQCLLMILRRFGPHLQDLEGLRFAVSAHTSSLRRAVAAQMQRLDKKR